MFQLDYDNRMLAGVCAGLAKDLGIDPIVPRLIFILLTFGAGGGVALYLILWILMALNTQ